MSTEAYRLVLGKQSGRVLSLVDRVSGAQLVAGQDGCLWGAHATGSADYVGGCSFGSRSADRFAYAWNSRTATLTLSYRAGGGPGIDATATVVAGPAAVDFQFTLSSRRPGTIETVNFPADLEFGIASAEAGYAPNFLPGVEFRPAFFSRVGSNVNTYPSRWAFADYLALDLTGGHLALYAVNPPPARLAPVSLGFTHTAEGACAGGSFCLTHAFQTWIRAEDAWTSPTIRVSVGSPARESILDYRAANGIDAYPSLAAKVGPRLPSLAAAPLIKADLWKGLPRFAGWPSALARLPAPALVHPVAFQPGGHDESDPDFLPPDATWGSTDDLRRAVAALEARGLLVMPYLNASWWNERSPTMAAVTAAAVAVSDRRGTPRLETYGAHAGYVVSPFVPAVRDRFGRLVDEWSRDVPVDCLFFDQIGARPWLRDFNPAAPDPLAYDDGWLALAAPYADRCLMVEDGWDRLAAGFSGFHGGLLLMAREHDIPNHDWGAGTWEPYPLADWLLHDKVLLYQHDLYEGTMTSDAEVLAWNLAFGFQLSYAWDERERSLESPWLAVVAEFQRALGPLYAGHPLDEYREIEPGVVASTFGTLRITANLSSGLYEERGFRLAPDGVLAEAPGVVAGAFTGTFDGETLSPGTHYLVVERGPSGATVRQPLGADTAVTVAASGKATAYARSGRLLGEVPSESRDGRVTFEYRAVLDGDPVAYYRIS